MVKAKPIQSATLTLQIESASHVLGLDDDQYIVCPAIDFSKKPKPPKKNLNTDRRGPRVVQVTVQQIANDDARRNYCGHAGIERLTLLLPRATMEQCVERLADIRKLGSLAMGATVDEHGDIKELTLNGEAVTFAISSETRPVREKAAAKTGTD